MNLLKKLLIPIQIIYYLKNKKIFNSLVEERSYRFIDSEKNHDNLAHVYKSEGKSPKDFRNYRNPIELFKDLRDGNIKPKKYQKVNLTLDHI